MEGILPLTLDAVERLKAELRRQGAPVVELLRPGLSDDELDDLTGPMGLSLPEELRVWWHWHDGVEGGHGRVACIGPSFPFYSLAQAVKQTAFQRGLGTVWVGDSDMVADQWWPSWVLALTDADGSVVACDCSGPRSEPAFTLLRMRDEPYDRSPPGVPSFGLVVKWWTDALASNAWVWSARLGHWTINEDVPIPPERRATNLV